MHQLQMGHVWVLALAALALPLPGFAQEIIPCRPQPACFSCWPRLRAEAPQPAALHCDCPEVFICCPERRGLLATLAFSIPIPIATYIAFDRLLKTPLERGLLWF